MSRSMATSVSTPSTISSPFALPATALRSAFSPATATGTPSCSSTTSTGLISNGTPRLSRIARRWGERLARTSLGAATGPFGRLLRGGRDEIGEEEPRLALGRLGRVGPVDHVLADGDGVVAADRPGRRLHRVRRADDLAGGDDGLLALEDHRDERPARDELDELAEERLALVLGVVALGEVLVDGHVLERDDAQALALEAGDDLAGQAARERVGLDEDQGPVHRGSVLPAVVGSVSYGEGGASYDAVAPCSTSPVGWRRRRRRGTGAWPGTSASQYGQIGHCGSSGLPQFEHGSLSLRMQFGQRRKSFSTCASQCGHTR